MYRGIHEALYELTYGDYEFTERTKKAIRVVHRDKLKGYAATLDDIGNLHKVLSGFGYEHEAAEVLSMPLKDLLACYINLETEIKESK